MTRAVRVPPSVAVASELAMVAEAVSACFAARGFRAITMEWPTDDGKRRGHPTAPAGQQVGLLICDLGSWERLREVWLLLRHMPMPWVVLTQAPAGPKWGAALDAGACVVLPGSTNLERACAAVAGAARGTALMDPQEHQRLVGLWAALLERREMVDQRVGSLTPREHEVLTMLHAGDTIARIAQLLGVSPVTVRSQVKAVLRKLDVNSQLGAVAALDELLAVGPWG